ncbi:MAG: hypothetical protein IPP08_07840 [Chlorobiota bacterium]|nr:hypothetical protein [Chlorobiota bacterium]QQS65690.1 MAG: hypothetical protein IPP08_07840 [Chlorobiota bacterium]
MFRFFYWVYTIKICITENEEPFALTVKKKWIFNEELQMTFVIKDTNG